jgi:hypothetical protein
MAEALAARQPAPPQRADPLRTALHATSKNVAPRLTPIDHLQRTLGNRGMARLLRFGVIQAKVVMGAADDQYEREANRIADEIMRMPEPATAVFRAQRSVMPVQRACLERVRYFRTLGSTKGEPADPPVGGRAAPLLGGQARRRRRLVLGTVEAPINLVPNLHGQA